MLTRIFSAEIRDLDLSKTSERIKGQEMFKRLREEMDTYHEQYLTLPNPSDQKSGLTEKLKSKGKELNLTMLTVF